MSGEAQDRQYSPHDFESTEEMCSGPYVTPVVLDLAGQVSGKRILDVGCGNGALAEAFVDRGAAELVGIDISTSGVEQARRLVPSASFQLLEAERIDEIDGTFDLIVSTEVVEHLYDPAQFLEGAFGKLAAGGRIILSTPYHGYLKNVVIAATGGFDEHVDAGNAGGHIQFWSRKSLTRALEAAGFRNVVFRGAGRLPRLWKSMVLAAEKR